MAPAQLASCLLVLAGIAHSSDGTSLLQRGASRQRTFAGLRFSPKDPAARTLLALDTNHDGTIDPDEITAFALAQGLDSRSATQEFSSIDTNEDGVLDSAELKQILGAGPSTGLAAAPQVKAKAPQPSATSAQAILALDTNHDGTIDPNEITAFALAQGLDSKTATEEFSSIDTNEDGVLDSAELKQVLGGNTELAAAPQGNLKATQASATSTQEDVVVEAPEAYQGRPWAAGPENLLAEQSAVAIEAPLAAAPAPIAAVAIEAPLAAVEAIAVAPVVEVPLAAAETIVAEAQLDPAKAVSAIDSAELISDESRNSMRKAAQEVAEELVLEENEEKEARSLDRDAADVRAQSTAAAKEAVQEALEAGSTAAHTKATELMAKIADLQEQAERAEVRAAALRAKAKIELEEGNQLLAVADQALKPEA